MPWAATLVGGLLGAAIVLWLSGRSLPSRERIANWISPRPGAPRPLLLDQQANSARELRTTRSGENAPEPIRLLPPVIADTNDPTPALGAVVRREDSDATAGRLGTAEIAYASPPDRLETIPHPAPLRRNAAASTTRTVGHSTDASPRRASAVRPAAFQDARAEAPLRLEQAKPEQAEPAQELPPEPSQHEIPVFEQPNNGVLDITVTNGLISLTSRDTPLNRVVSELAQTQGFNVVCGADASTMVSIVLRDVSWHEALTAVVSTAGCTWAQSADIIRVTSLTAGKNLSPDVQGRRLQVFSLDYASGVDMEKSIKGLLSPVGQVFAYQSSATDSRKPKDVLVVEDLPDFIDRISDYVRQLDQPPRQVLIEARILEVKLGADCVHGINFKELFSAMNTDVTLQLTGMATSTAPQAFFTKLGGGNLEALVECLQSTKNVKTLASPRVLVVDGQEATIQVGEQLGYKVTTTTETSTMQDVKFLNVGTILMVTPHISRDGRVWMKVEPKVSSGMINPTTELPEERTSQVTSQVLLNDGQGIVIGGLISESDSTNVQKLPILGDLWLVGWLFQRRLEEKSRTEIIVTLIPHVQPYSPVVTERDAVEVTRCNTPLLNNCMQPVTRPWEPITPDPLRWPFSLRRAGYPVPQDGFTPAPDWGAMPPFEPIPAPAPAQDDTPAPVHQGEPQQEAQLQLRQSEIVTSSAGVEPTLNPTLSPTLGVAIQQTSATFDTVNRLPSPAGARGSATMYR